MWNKPMLHLDRDMALPPLGQKQFQLIPGPVLRALGGMLVALLMWLCYCSSSLAQESETVYHLVLVPGQEQSFAELASFHGADLAQAQILNNIDPDRKLGDDQVVILPVSVEVALENGQVRVAHHAAAPGQDLAMVAAELSLPGKLLSRMNNMALDERLFPGQPVLVPVPVRTGPLDTIGQMKVEYLSPFVAQGTTGFIAVTLPKGLEPTMTWQGDIILMSPIVASGIQQTQRFLAPLPAHPLAIPSMLTIHLSYVNRNGVRVSGTLTNEIFEPNSFLFESIKIPLDIAEQLSTEGLEEEQGILNEIWSNFSPGPWPSTGWQRPVDLQFPTSSPFGSRRQYVSDVPYPYNFHSGQDYAANIGTPVLAAAAGTVVFTDELLTKGQTLVLDHGQGVLTGYWHLSQVLVELGDIVQSGQAVALVGNSGISTGAHLHWELRIQGVPVDPRQFLAVPLVPPDVQQ